MKFSAVIILLVAIIAAVSAVRLPRLAKGPFEFNPLCFKIKEGGNGEPIFSDTQFTDCTRKGVGASFVACKQNELCCPKPAGGSRCVKMSDLGL